MFNPACFVNSRPDGFGVLEIPPRNGEPPRFVPLRRTELHGNVSGPLADLHLVQEFSFTAADCPEPVEALYRFPLPGDAAVRSVTVTFGDVRITAHLTTRAEAEAEYAAAKAAGRQAALATREAPDIFTLMVAGIRPNETVHIETRFVLLARTQGCDWLLRIPLTTAPRYVRQDDLATRHAHGQPLAILRDPGHRFALDVRFHGIAAVASPTHGLALEQQGDATLRVRLAGGDVLPDRDCVLVWHAPQHELQPTLDVQCYAEQADDSLYLLANVTPPAQTPAETPAREVILLVDHSGSMHGAKWQAADWAVESFLAGMQPGDWFGLACFHNLTNWYAPALQPAEPARVDEAVQWLQRQRESGGTELGVALEQALDLPPAPGDPTRHVLIVTDAQVTDAGRLLRLAEAAAQGAGVRRISVLCIDAAPNDALVNELVRRSGGIARFLTSDPAQEDITTALDDVLSVWAEPVLTGLRVFVNRERLTGSRRCVPAPSGWSALDVGDLPAGQSVWLTGCTPRNNGEPLIVRLVDGDDAVLDERPLAPSQATAPSGLMALCGAPRVNALEYLIHARHRPADLMAELTKLGFDPSRIEAPVDDRVYAETQAEDAQATLRQLLADEALRYGLPSAETAFIAVREEVDAPVRRHVPVANALPHGWQMPNAGVPGGSMGARIAAGRVDAFAASGALGLTQAMMPQPGLGSGPQPAGMPQPLTGDTGLARHETAYHALFSGAPAFADGEAQLYMDEPAAGEAITLRSLRAALSGDVDAAALGPDCVVQLFVEDMTLPRARVRLRDLLRFGKRPLNLHKPAGAPLRIVLADSTGALAAAGAELTLELAW